MLGRELETLLKEERGQFFEFVSAYEQKRRGTQTKRPQDLAREIARILSGMVNADGGVLLVGVEPDKSLTGLPYSEQEIKELGEVPQSLLNPPLPTLHERIDLGNLLLLRFEASPGLEIRRVASGRTFYRIAGENPAVAPEQIRLLKDAKLSYSYERQHVHAATWEDLDDAAWSPLPSARMRKRTRARCCRVRIISSAAPWTTPRSPWPRCFFSPGSRPDGIRAAASTSSSTRAPRGSTERTSTWSSGYASTRPCGPSSTKPWDGSRSTYASAWSCTTCSSGSAWSTPRWRGRRRWSMPSDTATTPSPARRSSSGCSTTAWK